MVPAFNGLGYAMIFVRFLVNIYYVVITAWALFYLAIGFQKTLPWGSCEESWNTYNCYSLSYEKNCQEKYGNDFTYYKKNCTTIQEYCHEHGYDTGSYITGCLKDGNYTPFKDVVGEFGVSPAEDYFNGRVLGINKDESGLRYDWDDYGSIQGHLVGCLAAAWVLVCLSLIKGIQSYGKVAYVITLSPYFVLTALLSKFFQNFFCFCFDLITPKPVVQRPSSGVSRRAMPSPTHLTKRNQKSKQK